MEALVIGATGVTGKDLVDILLQDADYTKVTIFVRRSTGLSHAKLTEVITDFDKPEEVVSAIGGDVLFICLGTTLKTAGSKDKQHHIDYEIPAHFARLAKSNKVGKVVLLSAYGASAKSNVFYSRLKGMLEDDIEGIGFGQYIIFRPGLLLRKNTERMGERIFSKVLQFLNSIGLFKKFKPMPTQVLAGKMAKSAKIFSAGKHVEELDKIFNL